MRKLMARRRQEGRGLVQLTPSTETMKNLLQLAELTGGSTKGEAEMILRRGVLSALSEMRRLAERMGPVYVKARRYLPYASHLSIANSSVRVGESVLRASDWEPLAKELDLYYQTCARIWGWSKPRAETFLRRAAGC